MKKVLAVLLAAIFALSCLSGCREQPLLDPHDPVVLTLWHTYGEQADSPMNRLIDRFNSTVGMERGVVIRTTLITVAAKISDRLAEAQDGTPGAVPLPDLFFCHNNDAAGFGVDRLLDWNDYFTAFLYLSDNEKMPLQITLRAILINNSFSADAAASVKSIVTANAGAGRISH